MANVSNNLPVPSVNTSSTQSVVSTSTDIISIAYSPSVLLVVIVVLIYLLGLSHGSRRSVSHGSSSVGGKWD